VKQVAEARTSPHSAAAVRDIEKKFNYSKHGIAARCPVSADAGLLVAFVLVWEFS